MSTEAVLLELLADVEGRLAAAQLRLQELHNRVEELEAERYGLQLALSRRTEGLPEPDLIPPQDVDPPAGGANAAPPYAGYWQLLSRAEAVERVLEGADRPLTRQEVLGLLQQAGRQDDTADAVSAALAYLQRIDRAARTGRSQWVYRPVSPPT